MWSLPRPAVDLTGLCQVALTQRQCWFPCARGLCPTRICNQHRRAQACRRTSVRSFAQRCSAKPSARRQHFHVLSHAAWLCLHRRVCSWGQSQPQHNPRSRVGTLTAWALLHNAIAHGHDMAWMDVDGLHKPKTCYHFFRHQVVHDHGLTQGR